MKKLLLDTGLSSRSITKNISYGILATMLTFSSTAALSASKQVSSDTISVMKKKKYRAVAKSRAIKNSHIVTIKEKYVQAEAALIPTKRTKKAFKKAMRNIAKDLAETHGFELGHVFSKALKGFSATLNETQINALMLDERVDYVQQDEKLELFGSRSTSEWNLDAIDNAFAEQDGVYSYDYTGNGVTVYVVDQGITNQSGFFNENLMEEGKNIVPWGDTSGEDVSCESHGNKVAGIIANETYGIAPGVTLVPVRVATCDDVSAAGILRGLEWIIEDAESRSGPTVVNMSLGGKSTTYAEAVQATIDAGTVVVTSAGNSNDNACEWYPALIPDTITVAAAESTFIRASYSNWGECVDLFAPAGVSTVDRWSAGVSFAGTSASSPHVAGAAALYLEANPNATPAEVSEALTSNATQGLISDPQGSPNLFLNTRFLANADNLFPGRMEAEAFSSEEGIQIEETNDNGVDQSVAYINDNDSTTYTVSVATTGFYTIDFRVASPYAGNTIQLSSNGTDLGSMVVDKTGSWQDWQTVSTEVFLLAGQQNIKLTFNGSTGYLFNLNWFEANLSPDSGSLRLPGRIEAENYSAEAGIRIEATEDDSGQSIAYINNGDSVTYLADVFESGEYNFGIRVASPHSGNMINIYSDGNFLVSVEVDSTDGWQSWETLTTKLALEAGTQEITLEFVGNTNYLYNVNWFELMPIR